LGRNFVLILIAVATSSRSGRRSLACLRPLLSSLTAAAARLKRLGRLMDRVLGTGLRSFMRRGALRLTTSRGKVLEFGDGTGTPVAVRFTRRSAELAVLLDPELAVGDCYMNGTLVIEQASIANSLALVFSQARSRKPPRWMRTQWLLRYLWRRLAQFNPPPPARRNLVPHSESPPQPSPPFPL